MNAGAPQIGIQFRFRVTPAMEAGISDHVWSAEENRATGGLMNLRDVMGLPPVTTLRLTKLDAARRQLRSAIVMFLEGRDPVSIYTLASAAQDVLRSLLKAKGKEGVAFKDSDLIKPEGLKLWRDMVYQTKIS
jgi:hypothetical protein